MGVSTNAVIFYGYCWDEECELIDGEWETKVLKDRGVKNPWDDYPESISQIRDYTERRKAEEKWAEDHRAELDEWYAARKAVRAEFGCDIGRHCSGDYSMPYVFVEDSELTVRRGYPHPLAPDDTTAEDWWADRLAAFMTAVGIAKPDGQDSPQWWLVSYWSN